MWKSAAAITFLLPKVNRNVFISSVRYFLSDSFKLEQVWSDRLKSPILSKINVDDMFYELDNQFNHFAYASALDIDLYVNAINEDIHFDEIEEIVHKLRLSPEAVNIFPSTQHALIRLYIKFNKIPDIIRILDDRLNYGVFPDDYSSLMMMDTLIKQGNFRDAAKVSALSMLQEDFSNPLLKYMSLYVCHKYVENPVQWKEEENIENSNEGDDDDDDVIKVRVRYIRNPYFDDHFDLIDPQHIIGKTFHMIGSESSDYVGLTYRLLGLILHDKLAEANNFVKQLSSKSSQVLVKDGLDVACRILEEKLKSGNKDDKYQSLAEELMRSWKTIDDTKLFVGDSLLSLVEDKLKELVKEKEPDEIRTQTMLYQEWEKTRVTKLEEQLARINKEKDIAEIEYQKQRLKEKEEELYFFENEDKLDLIIEEKSRRKQEDLEREKMRKEFNMDFKPAVKIERKVKQSVKEIPPLESFFDENIPMKNVKTDL